MSGGVDSSVALHLLQRAGHDVVGVHMRNWDATDEDPGACTQDQDSEDAEAVCKQLGVEFREISFVKEYWNRVFEPLLDNYANGVVPNPDVACNREIKFGALLEHCVRDLGCSHLATGHYARTRWNGTTGEMELLPGLDGHKDQSYFLSSVPQSCLSRALFPLGEMSKSDVRIIAEEANLVTARKKESMGICFVGKRRRFGDFLRGYLETEVGVVVDEAGAVLGKHEGSGLYTVGQKMAMQGGQPHKWYVVSKDVATNVVVVGSSDSPSLVSSGLEASTVEWVSPHPPIGLEREGGIQILCRFRHGQPLCPAHLEALPDAAGVYTVRFASGQRAVQRGQTIAFYMRDTDEDEGTGDTRCLGGGTITKETARPASLLSRAISYYN